MTEEGGRTEGQEEKETEGRGKKREVGGGKKRPSITGASRCYLKNDTEATRALATSTPSLPPLRLPPPHAKTLQMLNTFEEGLSRGGGGVAYPQHRHF